ncbi:MAG: TonB family protein [Bacteroidota bacterium]
MKQHNSELARISQHLDELNREHRRKQARQTTIVAGSILALLLVGFLLSRSILFSSGGAKNEVEEGVFLLENVSPDLVHEYFATQDEGMIIKYKDLYVTLFSVEDYYDLVEKLSGNDTHTEFSDAFSTVDTLVGDNFALDPFIPLEPNTDLPTSEDAPLVSESKIIIQGDRLASSSLQFTISNFDPRLNYEVNFGDGSLKDKLQREFFHEYKKGGSYTVELKGYFGTEEIFSTSRKINIDKEATRPPAILVKANSRKPARTTPTSGRSVAANSASNGENGQENDRNIQAVNPPSLSLSSVGDAPVFPNSDQAETNLKDPSIQKSEGQADSEDASRSEALVSSVASPEIYTDPSASNTNNQPLRRYKKTYVEPLKIANQMPTFPGGSSALLNFLNERLNYPQAAKDFSVEGIVYVQFIVDEEGEIRNTQVVRGLGHGCDKEALRIVREMPRWIPGRHEGEIVPVIYTIPINFRLI